MMTLNDLIQAKADNNLLYQSAPMMPKPVQQAQII